jgi:hypothetical protein
MTEADWRASHDPAPLLTYAKQHVSERKIRLLSCACCRQVWEHLPDTRSRQGVEVAERFADDLASPRDLAKARNNALVVNDATAWAVYWATNTKAASPILNVFQIAAEAPARHATKKTRKADTYVAVQSETMRQQADLIREVVGNPYRPPRLSSASLGWEGGLVVGLAAGIYHDKAFDRMPYLGDALEEAGCDDERVLAHCRDERPHVLGCWVVDLLLGKA